jgi:hypothetical protein
MMAVLQEMLIRQQEDSISDKRQLEELICHLETQLQEKSRQLDEVSIVS